MKCKSCKKPFERKRRNQIVCSFECSISYSKALKEKKAKEVWIEKKKALKDEILTLSDYLKMAQQVFNEFIRLRDKDLPCISCGTKKSNLWDAGHWRSVGANPQLRFNELNVNKQCRKCNGYWGGMPIEYRKGLIEKYGIEIVEELESENKPKKYTIEGLKELIKIYKQKIKELKN